MENRHGLVVDGCVSQATATAERAAVARMVIELSGSRRITWAGDTRDYAAEIVQAVADAT
jgi:hypothetical protein